MEIVLALVLAMVLGFTAGHFHGSARALRYCTKKLEELQK